MATASFTSYNLWSLYVAWKTKPGQKHHCNIIFRGMFFQHPQWEMHPGIVHIVKAWSYLSFSSWCFHPHLMVFSNGSCLVVYQTWFIKSRDLTWTLIDFDEMIWNKPYGTFRWSCPSLWTRSPTCHAMTSRYLSRCTSWPQSSWSSFTTSAAAAKTASLPSAVARGSWTASRT